MSRECNESLRTSSGAQTSSVCMGHGDSGDPIMGREGQVTVAFLSKLCVPETRHAVPLAVTALGTLRGGDECSLP